jgi:hypothetical protein
MIIQQLNQGVGVFLDFQRKKIDTGHFERIPGFVSCRKCLKTYTYTPTTGTHHLNSHLCVVNYPMESTSSTSISTQMSLDNISNGFKQIKLGDKEINNFKSLMAKWICADLRPFAISEDVGLRKIFQELVSLGKLMEVILYDNILFLGAKHGNFDTTNIVRGADTLSNHIYDLADQYRSDLKEILREPFESEAICISPDMWSDRHKQVSYLGLSCTLVDAEFSFKALDLCCRPYLEVDQSGDNLLFVRKITC